MARGGAPDGCEYPCRGECSHGGRHGRIERLFLAQAQVSRVVQEPPDGTAMRAWPAQHDYSYANSLRSQRALSERCWGIVSVRFCAAYFTAVAAHFPRGAVFRIKREETNVD